MIGLNVGSGQRPFKSAWYVDWINVDVSPKHSPDLVCDGAHIPLESGTVDFFVLHHSLEHFGCGEASGLIKEAHRLLKHDGSLLVFIPDIRNLALRWLDHQIDDYIYVVNLMGAYAGEEGDRHKWHYTRDSLPNFLAECAPWRRFMEFDWRDIPGSSFAKDWWILAYEARK